MSRGAHCPRSRSGSSTNQSFFSSIRDLRDRRFRSFKNKQGLGTNVAT
jgi:hypothetical protein